MRKAHNISVGIYSIYIIFISTYIPDTVQKISLQITSIFGIILILGSAYFLLIDKETNRIKLYSKIISKDNGSNYIQIWLLLFITNLDTLHLFGTVFYLIISLTLLLFCIYAIIRDAIYKRTFISGVIIGCSLLGYCMYKWSKKVYTRNYGDEIIGSFWEKPDYKPKYLVKLFKDGSDQFYTVPAQLHVFYETFEEDYGEGSQTWSEKFIMIKTIYFNNGGYLRFDDCDLKEGKTYCIDQNDTGWYIELTEEKIN